MKINKKFGDKIYIEWVDAYSNDDWESVTDALKIPDEVYCYTNAFFLGQTKDFVIVIHTKGRTTKNDIMGKFVIPKALIGKVK